MMKPPDCRDVVQLYVPPDCMLNKDFLRQVFAEEKKLFALAEVKFIEVPKYDELSVINIFGRFKKDKKLMMYLPDRLPKGRNPDRTYFFNVLHTLYPEYVKELVKVAGNHRHQAASQSIEDGIIRVSDEWFAKLQEVPFVSGKYPYKSNVCSS